jgi:hypothetical protein
LASWLPLSVIDAAINESLAPLGCCLTPAGADLMIPDGRMLHAKCAQPIRRYRPWLGLGPELYICTTYDRLYGDFLAKNTSCPPMVPANPRHSHLLLDMHELACTLNALDLLYFAAYYKERKEYLSWH